MKKIHWKTRAKILQAYKEETTVELWMGNKILRRQSLAEWEAQLRFHGLNTNPLIIQLDEPWRRAAAMPDCDCGGPADLREGAD